MATLNMRYGGNIVSIPEGTEFSPGNYGTARLKFRVNSTSVGEFGLTTNTNAKEYCKLQMRVGGQICYIGRVSTTSYISGGSVDYHGSSIGSRSVSSASVSEYATSNASRSIEYYSSSMSTSTSRYTQVTSTEQVQTNYYTQQVLSKTEYVTYGNGSGNGTASYNPGIGDEGFIEPNYRTSSTETTRTLSAKILTNSSYKETYYNYWYRSQTWRTSISRDSAALNAQVTHTSATSNYFQTVKINYTLWNSHGTRSSGITKSDTVVGTSGIYYRPYYSTTYNGASKTIVNSTKSTYYGTNVSAWERYETSKSVHVTKEAQAKVTATYSSSVASIYTSYVYTVCDSVNAYNGANSTTYGSYSSRWTYYWISYVMSKASYYSTRTVREYSTRSYTGTTYYSSITRSTSSVSETIHNMNI